ncbi:MAG: exodeoxyribonuclease III [Proteobacteria bacterium]|nr:exodeoxyribonuclease III [Pseudomonadota bacterium]
MKIITLNVNGIRSAGRKGFFTWLADQQADIVCVQETKAQEKILSDGLYRPEGYHCYYFDALKPGYSGVGIFCKKKPDKIVTGLGWPIADQEGRYIQVDYPHFNIASLYMPSGTSGEARQKIKYEFMDQILPILKKIIESGKPFIICGDWNIAHKEIDLKNWKRNQNYTGFLPEERAWITQLLEKVGFVDAFRAVNQQPDQYTWWSHFGRAWENNVGWRIDYQMVTPHFKNKILSATIYKDQRFSDHAPLIMKYDFTP